MTEDYSFIDVPRNCISSMLEVCPLCKDTKTTSIPAQTIKLTVDPPYRTECSKCGIWWYSYRKDFHD